MFKDFFNRSSKKKKYVTVSDSKQSDVPAGIMTKCPKCKKIMYTKENNLLNNLKEIKKIKRREIELKIVTAFFGRIKV